MKKKTETKSKFKEKQKVLIKATKKETMIYKVTETMKGFYYYVKVDNHSAWIPESDLLKIK